MHSGFGGGGFFCLCHFSMFIGSVILLVGLGRGAPQYVVDLTFETGS